MKQMCIPVLNFKISSSPTDLRMSEEEIRNQMAATNLENIRRFAQASQEHHLMPRSVLQRATALSAAAAAQAAGGLNPLTAGLTASDYMRFAMPVRDTSGDNGDAISGSGTKLKCPFCERTYGYETNLRAHIRQRHQGIRVSCPYCPRTFTRNNTVRRHVQREHRHLVGRIPTKFGSTRVMPDPITAAAAAAAAAAHHHQQQQQRPMSPPPATSAAAAAAVVAAAAAGAASSTTPSAPKSPVGGGLHA